MTVASASDDVLPRTLIISEAPFGVGHGFGVTLSTFFAGWPADRFRLFYTREPAAAMADRLREGVTFADVPGHWGRRYGLELVLGRRPTWRGYYSRRWLRAALDGWHPQVIYTLVFSRETLAFAAWVAGVMRTPLVAHVADDGLDASQSTRKSTRQLLGDASRVLTISDEMRHEYLQRYGIASHVLHNGAADALFVPAPVPGNDVFTIRYLGSLLTEHHFNAMEDVAEAVRTLAAGGFNARLEICGGMWTRQNADRLSDGRTTVSLGEVSQAEGFELLKTADLLVVPISFDPAAFNAVRLSFPTKLPEYLASGTPTLVYGPAGCAPVEFCRRHGLGRIVDGRSIDRLAAAIRETAACREVARRRADRDRAFIKANHSAANVQARVRGILRSAAFGAFRP